jgi:transposase-like protein
MSVKQFTKAEFSILSKNIYVKRLSTKSITYSDEFKRIFIAESQKGKTSGTIFREYGFDTDILGKRRYRDAGCRWRNSYKQDGLYGLTDTRKGNSGRPNEKELSIEEKYKRVKVENNLLKAENEMLKKIDLAERRLVEKK